MPAITIEDPDICMAIRHALRREIRELKRITRKCRESGEPSEFLEEELSNAEKAYEALNLY